MILDPDDWYGNRDRFITGAMCRLCNKRHDWGLMKVDNLIHIDDIVHSGDYPNNPLCTKFVPKDNLWYLEYLYDQKQS